MQAAIAPQVTIEQVVDRIFASRRITRLDQHLLMSLTSKDSLSAQEESLTRRVYDALHKGLLRVTN